MYVVPGKNFPTDSLYIRYVSPSRLWPESPSTTTVGTQGYGTFFSFLLFSFVFVFVFVFFFVLLFFCSFLFLFFCILHIHTYSKKKT